MLQFIVANLCTFSEAFCKNNSLRLSHAGDCNSCPYDCYKVDNPLCGSDGKTYGKLIVILYNRFT